MVTKKKNNKLNQPATKADVARSQKLVKADIDSLGRELRSEMKQMETRMLQHFDVVAENIHQDVAGANRDEISAIQDKVRQHDTDIATIKQKVGIS